MPSHFRQGFIVDKKCIGCGVIKLLSEFYKHSGMSDGHLNKCKDCCKQAANDNRAAKIEQKRAYDRSRSNLPHRVKARQNYAKSASGVSAVAAAKARYKERNPLKRAAHVITGNAIRAGILIKQPCESCGAATVHAHHDDYGFPLSVRWLCPKHHKEWHILNAPAFTGCNV
jgi:ribosomal protein S27AE